MLQVVGPITEPPELANFGSVEDGGIGKLLTLALSVLIIGAGIYALFNFVIAGYTFLSAEGDPKKVAAAWAKIWQSIIGLTVAAGSLVLAAVVGQLVFGNAAYILSPTIPTP
jgi:hypothetical protein